MTIRTKKEISRSAKAPVNGAAIPGTASGEMAPMTRIAERTFRRDLPKLLRLRNPGRQWVAYRGSRRLGFAATKHELFKRYMSKGIERGELYVRNIAPAPSSIEILYDAQPTP